MKPAEKNKTVAKADLALKEECADGYKGNPKAEVEKCEPGKEVVFKGCEEDNCCFIAMCVCIPLVVVLGAVAAFYILKAEDPSEEGDSV